MVFTQQFIDCVQQDNTPLGNNACKHLAVVWPKLALGADDHHQESHQCHLVHVQVVRDLVLTLALTYTAGTGSQSIHIECGAQEKLASIKSFWSLRSME